MNKIPPIKAVMTAFPYWIDAGATVADAKKLMDEHGIRHLPVTEKGKMVSVVTDRDIRHWLDPKLSPAGHLKVREVCVMQVYVVDLTEPLDRVLTKMAQEHIGSALVVKEGRLAGIFTVTDACKVFAELLHTLFPGSGTDAA